MKLRLCALAVFLAPVSAMAGDNVAGNLIQFNSDGCWSWYMDERAVVDPTNATALISSEASSRVAGVKAGSVRVTTFGLDTGERRTLTMGEIQEDDHNAGGLLILPNGKYLTMYSNHGNSRMGDSLTRFRVSANPHDGSAWTPEQTFDWKTTPGWGSDPYPKNNVSYNNLYYLSAEDRVYDFCRGTHQAMNILTFDYKTNTAAWGGQFEQSAIPGYGQGYFKFASNGVDRIYFIGTETHPRGCNTSIYSGYIQGGKSHGMDGTVLDENIFDSAATHGATVPDIASFTLVQKADAEGTGDNRLWTSDLELGADGNLAALYTSRAGSSLTDHRLHYARWDGTAWHVHEIAKMGQNIYKTEEDYTGIGAVVPDNLNVVYIATPINPATGAATPKREIYRGTTKDAGATWTWAAITSNSTFDNFRPIVPRWNASNTLVAWFRGTYTTAQNINATVVGIIDRTGERVGPAHYEDATPLNTTRADGNAIGQPGSPWHVLANVGNGLVPNVLEAGPADAPTLKTTLTDLADGTYDFYAYFWASPAEDWRVQIGTDPANLMLVRQNGAQQAEQSQFDAASGTMILTTNGANLYRTYVGRKTVKAGAAVSIFVGAMSSPTATDGSARTWYDGVGYAKVTGP